MSEPKVKDIGQGWFTTKCTCGEVLLIEIGDMVHATLNRDQTPKRFYCGACATDFQIGTLVQFE